jgi:calcium permeable stress-gated cation channel
MSGTNSGAQSTSTDPADGNAGIGQNNENQSIKTFAASLSTAAVVFGVQIVLFLLLSGNWKVRRSKKSSDKSTARQSLFHKI